MEKLDPKTLHMLTRAGEGQQSIIALLRVFALTVN
jgi:hypothetical protein